MKRNNYEHASTDRTKKMIAAGVKRFWEKRGFTEEPRDDWDFSYGERPCWEKEKEIVDER